MTTTERLLDIRADLLMDARQVPGTYLLPSTSVLHDAIIAAAEDIATLVEDIDYDDRMADLGSQGTCRSGVA